jgi:hypothetical protein
MSEHHVLIRQLHAEHRPGQHGHYLAFYFDCFPWVYSHWVLEDKQSRRPKWAPACKIKNGRLAAVIAGELAGAFFARARFVHGERTAGDFLAVERRNRSVGAGRIGESDEAEAA